MFSISSTVGNRMYRKVTFYIYQMIDVGLICSGADCGAALWSGYGSWWFACCLPSGTDTLPLEIWTHFSRKEVSPCAYVKPSCSEWRKESVVEQQMIARRHNDLFSDSLPNRAFSSWFLHFLSSGNHFPWFLKEATPRQNLQIGFTEHLWVGTWLDILSESAWHKIKYSLNCAVTGTEWRISIVIWVF